MLRRTLTKLAIFAADVVGGLRRKSTDAEDFAKDFGLDAGEVAKVIAGVTADLQTLASGDVKGAKKILSRAAEQLHLGVDAGRDAVLDQWIGDLREPHLTILREFKSGKKRREIAERLGMTERAVERSLLDTYVSLRMQVPVPDRHETGIQKRLAS
jgi:hypothetical protein